MSRWRRCLVLLLLAFATTSLLQARRASAGPPERDLWYVISDGEQRYGSIHVVVRQREHGQVEYAVESLVRIEFFRCAAGVAVHFFRNRRFEVLPDQHASDIIAPLGRRNPSRPRH